VIISLALCFLACTRYCVSSQIPTWLLVDKTALFFLFLAWKKIVCFSWLGALMKHESTLLFHLCCILTTGEWVLILS
jgi:hypothetical protein